MQSEPVSACTPRIEDRLWTTQLVADKFNDRPFPKDQVEKTQHRAELPRHIKVQHSKVGTVHAES